MSQIPPYFRAISGNGSLVFPVRLRRILAVCAALEVCFLSILPASALAEPAFPGQCGWPLPATGEDCNSCLDPVHTDPGSYPPPLFGQIRYVVIFVRFSDGPAPPDLCGDSDHLPCDEYFQAMFSDTEPGLGHYWNESSRGLIDIEATVIEQWYDLPLPRSSYVLQCDEDPEPDVHLCRLAQQGASVADLDVDFHDFGGIVFVVNEPLPFNLGHSEVHLQLDGEPGVWRVCWLDEYNFSSEDVAAHEIGHSLGIPFHSCAPGSTYASQWDVMSSRGTCEESDPLLGCLPVRPIAYLEDRLGWVPSASRFAASTGTTRLYTLNWLTETQPPEFLLGRISLGEANQFYTLEARTQVGYDRNVPGDAVLIHRVGPAERNCWAEVVDDGTGDTNGPGAMWAEGESFLDDDNAIMVSVLEASALGFDIAVSTAPRDPCYVDVAAVGGGDGSEQNPFPTVALGVGGVVPGKNVVLESGEYPETLTIRKPCRLTKGAGIGPAIIGQ